MEDPGTGIALRGVTDLTHILNPLVRFVGPYITVCNYFNYAWTHAGEHLSEPDATGTAQRTLLNQASRTVNPTAPSVGSLGAREPVNGEHVHLRLAAGPARPTSTRPRSTATATPTASPASAATSSAPTRSATPSYNTVIDPHIPGSQGTTFTGRPRVPEGQTFTRAPESGPRMPPELDP